MFLNISKKLQVLLKGVMDNADLYLVIYRDNNWAILNYWSEGSFAFNPQKETEEMLEQIDTIIKNGKAQ